MTNRGFECRDEKRQKELRLIMPEELQSQFFATIYCRGELMDSTEGDPEKYGRLCPLILIMFSWLHHTRYTGLP